MGSVVTFTDTVAGAGATPTGSVVWTVSGPGGINSCGSSTTTLDGSGKATCTITIAAAGAYSVSAAYGGDSNYNTATSGADTQTVAPATSGNVVTHSPASPTFGQTVTFTATNLRRGGHSDRFDYLDGQWTWRRSHVRSVDA